MPLFFDLSICSIFLFRKSGASRRVDSLRKELDKLQERFAPEIERARKSVGSRLRSTMAALLEENPNIGRHFADAVALGSLCMYRPEQVPDWNFDAA